MSKRINVNPDHYKTAGRERMGEHLTQDIEKQQLKRARPGKFGAWVLPGDRRAAMKPPGGKTRRG